MSEVKAKNTPKKTPLTYENGVQDERDRIVEILYTAGAQLEIYAKHGKKRKFRKICEQQLKAVLYIYEQVSEDAN